MLICLAVLNSKVGAISQSKLIFWWKRWLYLKQWAYQEGRSRALSGAAVPQSSHHVGSDTAAGQEGAAEETCEGQTSHCPKPLLFHFPSSCDGTHLLFGECTTWFLLEPYASPFPSRIPLTILSDTHPVANTFFKMSGFFKNLPARLWTLPMDESKQSYRNLSPACVVSVLK